MVAVVELEPDNGDEVEVKDMYSVNSSSCFNHLVWLEYQVRDWWLEHQS
jgi:hypothetical protein